MSTPATLKEEEKARQRAAARRNQANADPLQPLSAQQSITAWTGPRMNSNPAFLNYRDGRPSIDFTDDRGAGKQYTSFESPGARKKKSEGVKQDGNKLSRPLSSPEVVDVPIDVDTDDYKIDPENIVGFNGRQHFLSNLFQANMCIEGHEYPSVEHYYQACKLYMLGGPRLAMQIRRIPDSGNVKVAAKRLLRGVVSAEEIEEWKRDQAPSILHHAIVYKYVQNVDLREKLLQTKDAILAHTYERENFFATACDQEQLREWAKKNAGQIIKLPSIFSPDTLPYVPLIGNGKNLLGAINMKVRQQLRVVQADQRAGFYNSDQLLAAMQKLTMNDREISK